MQNLFKELLIKIGEDPNREGLLKTPERLEKAYKFLCKGYNQNPKEVLNDAIFCEECDDMIIVKDIELYSMCEHHMLPFFGKCHVAYIPNGKIIGLSKIPRLIDIFARRLQVQERLTTQIAKSIYELINPKGVAVVIEAKHMCMIMRGVEKQNSIATTSSMLGAFRKHLSTREEFLRLIKN